MEADSSSLILDQLLPDPILSRIEQLSQFRLLLLYQIICRLISIRMVSEHQLHWFDLHTVLGMRWFKSLDQVELDAVHHMAMNL